MKILGWISIILIACSMLCGLWLKYAPRSENFQEGVNFHAMLSISTLLICLLTIILYMVKR
jgi:cytochrome b561